MSNSVFGTVSLNGQVWGAALVNDKGDTVDCVVFGLHDQGANFQSNVAKTSVTESTDNLLVWDDGPVPSAVPAAPAPVDNAAPQA